MAQQFRVQHLAQGQLNMQSGGAIEPLIFQLTDNPLYLRAITVPQVCISQNI